MIKSSYAGNCQGSDTICFTIEQARKVLTAAKERDIYKERINLLQGDVSLINQRISQKDSIIADLRVKDFNNQSMVMTMKEQRVLLEDQKKILLDQIGVLNKTVRRMKRRQFFTAAGGVLATGVMVYIAATK